MLICILLMTGLLPQAEKHLPVSAHNCYAGASDDRLKEALGLGLDNIEIDLGWDEKNQRLIVGHDEKPSPSARYPEFETYIQPLIAATRRPDGAPHVLTIDWKTSEPRAVAKVKAFLDEHADLFSSATKSEPSTFTERRLTVCFTGSEAAKDHYDRMVAANGVYRAFRDRVYSGSDYREDPAAYAMQKATTYHRFLTFYWGVVERGGPPSAGTWTEAEADRLRKIVESAHRQGYRVRFYCLNAGGGIATVPYRFASLDAARVRWLAAADLSVDWIASDNYAEIAKALRSR